MSSALLGKTPLNHPYRHCKKCRALKPMSARLGAPRAMYVNKIWFCGECAEKHRQKVAECSA